MSNPTKAIDAFASQFSYLLAEWKDAEPLVKWDKALADLVSIKAWDKITKLLEEKKFECFLHSGVMNALYRCQKSAKNLSLGELHKTVMELINVAPTRSSSTLTMARALTPQFVWMQVTDLRNGAPAVEFQCSVITNLLGVRNLKRFFDVCPQQRPQVVQLWGYENTLVDSGPKVNMVRDSWFYNIVREMVILGCRWLAADGLLLELDDGYWVYRHIVSHCVSAVRIKATVAGADSLLLTDMFCAIVSNIMKTHNFDPHALALIAANSQNLVYILDALMLVLCRCWSRKDAWDPAKVRRVAVEVFPSIMDCWGHLQTFYNQLGCGMKKPEFPVRLIDFVNVWGWRAEVMGEVFPDYPTSRPLARSTDGDGGAIPQGYIDGAARFLSFGGGELVGSATHIFNFDASIFDPDILRKQVRLVGNEPLLGIEYWPEAFTLNGDALRELERLAIGQGARADFVTKNPVNSGSSSKNKPSSKKRNKKKVINASVSHPVNPNMSAK